MVELTQEEFNGLFAKHDVVRKAESGAPICPYCENALSATALAYWNGSTEAGTPFCELELGCDVCGNIIWRGGSWYPGIDDRAELLCEADALFDDKYSREEGIREAFQFQKIRGKGWEG